MLSNTHLKSKVEYKFYNYSCGYFKNYSKLINMKISTFKLIIKQLLILFLRNKGIQSNFLKPIQGT